MTVSAVLLSSGGAATAQPAPAAGPKDDSTTVSGVTVEAQRELDLKKAFQAKVDKFVQSEIADGPHGNLIRWMKPVCIGVEGLSSEANAFVYQRLLAVAKQAGVPTGSPDCDGADVFVEFTAKPVKYLDDLAKSDPKKLGFVWSSDAKTVAAHIFRPPMSVLFWQQISPMAAYNLLDPNATRIRNDFATEFIAAKVVVDPSALKGQRLGKIADHIAARVFASPFRPNGCAPLPTVLDALDPACPDNGAVNELTAYDKALLKGLYHSDPNLAVEFERQDLRTQLMQDTAPPNAEGGGLSSNATGRPPQVDKGAASPSPKETAAFLLHRNLQTTK
jgi:hypothetical protein